MRILVWGASGSGGSRLTHEATARGHSVTAVSRTAPDHLRGNASSPEDVARLSAGHDVVISATRPRDGQEGELVETAKAMVIGLRASGVRLMLVGGAASLLVPGSELTLMETPDFPAALLPIARACAAQYELVRSADALDWTYVSPPALLEPGVRTGRYRKGYDHLVTSATGESRISVEDFAVALVDEAEQAQHIRQRFTVGY